MADDAEIDPLDAYMASLGVPSAATAAAEHRTSVSSVAATSALEWSTARRWRCTDAQQSSSSSINQRTGGNDDVDVTTSLPSRSSSAVVKNRRYRRLQQLLRGEKVVQDLSQPGAMEASPADWYFSDAMMQQRNPALFHFHLGQYLPAARATAEAAEQAQEASAQTAAASASSNRGINAQPVRASSDCSDADQLLSSFLLSTNDRREMEVRRALEQRTWGKFTTQDVTDARAREKALFQHDNDEDEEESDDESSSEHDDGETKSDATSAVSNAEPVGIDERRQVLVDLMSQRFLQGSDHAYIDYSEIDANAALDDLEQMQRDAEDAYFDMADDDCDG